MSGQRHDAATTAPRFKLYRSHMQTLVVIGPWAAYFSWPRSARYMNGSRWFSGWHRWRDQPEY